MQRVTIKDLESIIKGFNLQLGYNPEPWTADQEGRMRANLGSFYLYQAYNAFYVHQMMTPGGGVRDVGNLYGSTKRELYHKLQAFRSAGKPENWRL